MKLNTEQQNLVLENMNLVYYIVNKFFYMNFGNVSKEDLIGEGMVCLCRCALYYNKDKGVKFSTYSCRCLKKHLAIFLQNFYENSFTQESEILDDGYYDTYNFDIREEIEEFLGKYLLEKEVKIMIGYYFNNKNIHQLAEELGYKNAKTVNSMRFHILEKLRSNNEFKDKYIEYFI